MRERKERFWYKHVDEDEIFYQIFTFDEVMNGNQFDVLPDNPMLRGFRMTGDHDEYTGLEDRNNTEIYEGDIVRHYACGIMAIEYSTENSGFFIGDTAFTYQWAEDVEVIGNIHENPELLEEKTE